MSLLVTAEHLREAKRRHGGYCTPGVELWFKRYDLSLREFLRNGYPVEVIEATGDEFGMKVARIARGLE